MELSTINVSKSDGKTNADENTRSSRSNALTQCLSWMKKLYRISNFEKISILLLLASFHIYLVFALVHDFRTSSFLLYLIGTCWILFIFARVLKIQTAFLKVEMVVKSMDAVIARLTTLKWANSIIYSILLFCVLAFLVIDSIDDLKRLTGLSGYILLIAILYILSKDRRKINPRPVVWCLLLQIICSLIMIRCSWMSGNIQAFAKLTAMFLHFSNNGTQFVYGFLANPPNICGMSPVFAFSTLQVIVFFGAAVAVVSHLKVTDIFIRILGWILPRTTTNTPAETLTSLMGIVFGQCGTPFIIRSHLSSMTSSELHTVVTSGFASVAGPLYAIYVKKGACPSYLVMAAVSSSFGALACSKMMYPMGATEEEEDRGRESEEIGEEIDEREPSSVLECLSQGAVSAVEVVAAIAANMIVFISIVAFINCVVEYAGENIGYRWNLQTLFTYSLYPLVCSMGVDVAEALTVSNLLATKIVYNEIRAFESLAALNQQNSTAISPHSTVISTFALAGFNSISSIGFQVAILFCLIPSRRRLISNITMRAWLTALINSMITASLAGILTTAPDYCGPPQIVSCFNVSSITNGNNFTETSLINEEL